MLIKVQDFADFFVIVVNGKMRLHLLTKTELDGRKFFYIYIKAVNLALRTGPWCQFAGTEVRVRKKIDIYSFLSSYLIYGRGKTQKLLTP